jgi:hypothetical protein
MGETGEVGKLVMPSRESAEFRELREEMETSLFLRRRVAFREENMSGEELAVEMRLMAGRAIS